jgi:hypothetical protein
VIRRFSFVLFLSLLLSLPLNAQQTGASLSGHVFDPTGAPIVGAKIVITSTTTGSVYSTESDSAGIYRIPFAAVGEYTLTAEKASFKTFVQKGITLIIDQKATVDIELQLGSVSTSVTVVADAPILQVQSADRSYTVDQPRIVARSTAMLNTMESTLDAPGESFTSSSNFELGYAPYATGGMSGGVFNGGLGGNNYMIDGVASSYGGTKLGDAWNPIDVSVQEVSVQSTMYDAQYGWSSGGMVNTITKGGTNKWHGGAKEYITNTVLMANSYQNNVDGLPRSPDHQNQFGFNVGGPVIKNKFFVFYAYEKMIEYAPNSFTTAVPTAAEVQGNFSGLYTSAAKSAQVLLYDPTTTTLCPAAVAWCTGVANGTYARETFSAEYGTNNTIPSSLINTVAGNVLKLIPAPNHANGYNDAGNLINLGAYRENSNIEPQDTGRADLNLSDKTHAFVRVSVNALAEDKNFVYSTPSYIDPADTTPDFPYFRNNQAYSLQVVRTFNPTTVLEFRTGMTRYQNSPGGGGEGANFNLSSLGFSSTYVSQAYPWFPKFSWSGYAGAGSTGPTGFTTYPTFNTELVLAKTHGEHNFRFGFQNYETGENSLNPGSVAGNFTFNGDLTTANPTSQTAATGNGVADFLLGDPSSAYITVQLSPAWMMHQYSLFTQDDYHISRKLTLNFGLRWDYQGTVTERHNATLAGFCATCANPLQVSGLTLLGGPLFAGVAPTPRGIFNPKYANFGPRFGFAYDLGHSTVVRGGYGMIYAANFDLPGLAPGYSQNTNMLTSIQTGIPNPAVSLQDPFPTGVLTPVGAKYGMAQNLGNSISFADRDMNIPRTQQFSLDVQHQFGHNWLLSVGYVGTRGSRLPVTQSLDYIPLADMPYTYSFQTNPTGLTAAQLNSNVTNPFTAVPSTSPYYSLITGTYMSPTSSSITNYHLTYQYPQFSGVSEAFEPIGRSRYNSLQAEFNKRMSNGLDFIVNYTWCKTMQDTTFLNAQDGAPSWSIYQYDPHQMVKINIAYYLPFGPGKQFLSSTSPVVSRLVDGWSWGASSELSQGFPIASPSGVAPTGAAESVPNPTLGQWFNSCTENAAGTATVNCPAGITTPAWRTTVADQLVTWSPYLDHLRGPGFHQVEMSLSKKTTIEERYDLIFRADFHNAFNSLHWFGGPDTSSTDSTFGTIAPAYSTPSSDPRTIILSLKFEF